MFKAYGKAINKAVNGLNEKRTRIPPERRNPPGFANRPTKTLSSWLKNLVFPGRKEAKATQAKDKQAKDKRLAGQQQLPLDVRPVAGKGIKFKVYKTTDSGRSVDAASPTGKASAMLASLRVSEDGTVPVVIDNRAHSPTGPRPDAGQARSEAETSDHIVSESNEENAADSTASEIETDTAEVIVSESSEAQHFENPLYNPHLDHSGDGRLYKDTIKHANGRHLLDALAEGSRKSHGALHQEQLRYHFGYDKSDVKSRDFIIASIGAAAASHFTAAASSTLANAVLGDIYEHGFSDVPIPVSNVISIDWSFERDRDGAVTASYVLTYRGSPGEQAQARGRMEVNVDGELISASRISVGEWQKLPGSALPSFASSTTILNAATIVDLPTQGLKAIQKTSTGGTIPVESTAVAVEDGDDYDEAADLVGGDVQVVTGNTPTAEPNAVSSNVISPVSKSLGEDAKLKTTLKVENRQASTPVNPYAPKDPISVQVAILENMRNVAAKQEPALTDVVSDSIAIGAKSIANGVTKVVGGVVEDLGLTTQESTQDQRKRLPAFLAEHLSDKQVKKLWSDVKRIEDAKAAKGESAGVKIENKIHALNKLLRKYSPTDLNITHYDLYLKGFALGRRVNLRDPAVRFVGRTRPETLSKELVFRMGALPGGKEILDQYQKESQDRPGKKGGLTLDEIRNLAQKLPDSEYRDQFGSYMEGAVLGLSGE